MNVIYFPFRRSRVHLRAYFLNCIFAILFAMLITCGCGSIRTPSGVSPSEKIVVTTGYCRCGSCCGWHRNWYGKPVCSYGPNAGKTKKVDITASGSRAAHGTIAADASGYPFGTVIYVPGYGYGRVEDRGEKVKGNHIDLYFRTHRQALQWGVQKKQVKIWLPASAGNTAQK